MFLSSLSARVDPSDWLDEELPVFGRGELVGGPVGPDSAGSAVSYSPVAELDDVDVAERGSVIVSRAAEDDWDADLPMVSSNSGEFHICQHKLNR
ncbi:hypothetical protein BH09ACT7_BH09ACT7_26430 [soil metagenome]